MQSPAMFDQYGLTSVVELDAAAADVGDLAPLFPVAGAGSAEDGGAFGIAEGFDDFVGGGLGAAVQDLRVGDPGV